jgi:hypothetical protein
LATLVALAGLAILAALLVPGVAAAAKPSVTARSGDSIQPGFVWRVPDYAARCEGGALDLRVHGAKDWRARIAGGRAHRKSFNVSIPLTAGQRVNLIFKRQRRDVTRRFHVRCLPDDFPPYSFHRLRPGGADLFMVAPQTIDENDYAVAFNGDGVPVWWFASPTPVDAKVLPDGTISFFRDGRFDIRTLSGKLIRRIGNGNLVDPHDLQLLDDGNYLIGEGQVRTGVDATAFRGDADAQVADIEIQELTPAGNLVWSWDSADHIGLEETGRWWDTFGDQDVYDISHWNAVELDRERPGRYMYLSFRNLDALYKVNRKTGEIVWKLGGTETPESLEILNDPRGGYPLGGQHDVRVLRNGDITVSNNRTGLADQLPRANRYRIDEAAGTATLVESVSDAKVPSSFCCGSARRLPNKSWLVAWGAAKVIGAYEPDGRPIYRLRSPAGLTYRANPVPGFVGVGDLRRAMDEMNAEPAG